MIAAIDVIEEAEYYKKLPNLDTFDLRYYIVRTLYVLLTGALAISIPNLGRFLDFNGALAATSV